MNRLDPTDSDPSDAQVARLLAMTDGDVTAEVMRRIGRRTPSELASDLRLRLVRRCSAAAGVIFASMFAFNSTPDWEARVLERNALSAVVAIDEFDVDDLATRADLFGELFTVEIPE